MQNQEVNRTKQATILNAKIIHKRAKIAEKPAKTIKLKNKIMAKRQNRRTEKTNSKLERCIQMVKYG